MIRTRPLQVDRKLAERAKAILASSAGLEGAIQFLRDEKLGKIESIKTLSVIASMSLGEAKEKIHYSQAWHDRQESDERLHETAFEALRLDGFVEKEIDPADRVTILP